MILSTRESIEGYRIVESLGIVRGSTVRVRHLGNDILAGFKNLVGGEIKEYTELMSDAREQAIDRMVADAEEIGADAILTVRFTTSMLMRGASEILAFGTAVRLEKTVS
ncbi:MAG: YbjQ family protein [Betaproteobacteria bacterium]|nr:YbjQ family protein [Betaproteobacteria bacterium]